MLPILKGLVFLVPLAFYVGLDDTYDLAKLTALYLGCLALLGAWLGWALWSGETPLVRTPLELPLAATAIVLLLSSYFSWDTKVSWSGQYGYYMFGTMPLLACAVVFQFSAAALKNVPSQGSLFRLIPAAAALSGAYGVLQYFGLEPFTLVGKNPGGRVWSTFGNPLYLAAYLMMGAVISSSMALAAVSKRQRILYAATAVFLTAALSLTGSRSAWLGLVAGLIFLAACAVKLKADRRALGIYLGLPLAVALSLVLLSPLLRGRLGAIPGESLHSPRLSGWISGLWIAADHPLIGTGPDTFVYSFRSYKNAAYHEQSHGRTTQAHAHNDLIQWAATTGFLGLGIYLWLLVAAAWAGFKALERSAQPSLSAGALAALAALWIQNLFNFSTIGANVTAAILLGGLVSAHSRVVVFKLALGPRGRGALGILLGVGLAYGVTVALRPWRADAAFKSALGDLTVNGRLSAARKMEKAVSLNPWVSLYRSQLGTVYRELARAAATPAEQRRWIDRALHHALEDAGRHPMSADQYNNLGVVWMHRSNLLKEDQSQEAFGAFRRAVSLDPLCTEAWANLARMAHYFVELKEETRLWRLVLELDPRHKAAREILDKRR